MTTNSHPQNHTDTDKEFTKKAKLIFQAIDKIHPSYPKLIARSFVVGIFTGLGATIGASIVISLLAFLLTQLETVPFINTIIENSQIQEQLSGNDN